MTTTVGMQLAPLDVLFFRDGRPFEQGAQAASELPLPQTLAGAVWTGLLERHGCDFRRMAEVVRSTGEYRQAIVAAGGPDWIADVAVRGPWLARLSGKVPEVLVRVPPVLIRPKKDDDCGKGSDKKELARLCPERVEKLPGWKQSVSPEHAGLRPLWTREREAMQPASGYLTPSGLQKFLAEERVACSEVMKPEDLFGFQRRTGIGIDSKLNSASEGLIYGASFLVLQTGVGFYAEVQLPDHAPTDALAGIETLAFGGEGRRVRVTTLTAAECFRWPQAVPKQPRQKPLVMLTTPALFTESWRPGVFNGQLVAAAVPGAVPVSGWDLARGGPKPTRFAAPAGSVFFLNESKSQWPSTLSESERDASQGWGCYVTGVWTDE